MPINKIYSFLRKKKEEIIEREKYLVTDIEMVDSIRENIFWHFSLYVVCIQFFSLETKVVNSIVLVFRFGMV